MEKKVVNVKNITCKFTCAIAGGGKLILLVVKV